MNKSDGLTFTTTTRPPSLRVFSRRMVLVYYLDDSVQLNCRLHSFLLTSKGTCISSTRCSLLAEHTTTRLPSIGVFHLKCSPLRLGAVCSRSTPSRRDTSTLRR